MTPDDADDLDSSAALNPLGLQYEELKQLRTRFLDEECQPRKLNMQEFVEALSFNLQLKTEADREFWHSELCTLFQKIDASCQESVDWEEFTTFMLLHMPVIGADESGWEFSGA